MSFSELWRFFSWSRNSSNVVNNVISVLGLVVDIPAESSLMVLIFLSCNNSLISVNKVMVFL